MKNSTSSFNESITQLNEITHGMELQAQASDRLEKMASNLNASARTIEDIIENSVSLKSAMNHSARAETAVQESGRILSTLAMRLTEHADFLNNIIDNFETIRELPDHHGCTFGKWYDAHIKEYGHIPAFAEIEEVHAKFHVCAKNFIQEPISENVNELQTASYQVGSNFIKLMEHFLEKEYAMQ